MGDGATQLLITPGRTKEALREYDTTNPVCKYVIAIIFFLFCFLSTLISIMFYAFNKIVADVIDDAETSELT